MGGRIAVLTYIIVLFFAAVFWLLEEVVRVFRLVKKVTGRGGERK